MKKFEKKFFKSNYRRNIFSGALSYDSKKKEIICPRLESNLFSAKCINLLNIILENYKSPENIPEEKMKTILSELLDFSVFSIYFGKFFKGTQKNKPPHVMFLEGMAYRSEGNLQKAKWSFEQILCLEKDYNTNSDKNEFLIFQTHILLLSIYEKYQKKEKKYIELVDNFKIMLKNVQGQKNWKDPLQEVKDRIKPFEETLNKGFDEFYDKFFLVGEHLKYLKRVVEKEDSWNFDKEDSKKNEGIFEKEEDYKNNRIFEKKDSKKNEGMIKSNKMVFILLSLKNEGMKSNISEFVKKFHEIICFEPVECPSDDYKTVMSRINSDKTYNMRIILLPNEKKRKFSGEGQDFETKKKIKTH